MRKLVIIAFVGAACSRGAANGDSAITRDSLVAGPPAIPSSVSTTDSAGTLPGVRRSPETTSAAPPTRGAAGSPAPQSDSIRGTVAVVGTSFDKRVVVVPTAGHRLDVTGPLAVLVGRVAGAEVTLVGPVSGTQIEARSFAVRAVDNQPAIDGILKTEGSTLYIVTPNGTRTRIATPPPPLVGRDGARVWITGDPSKGVASWGFIDPQR